jgi:hypothetical protein
MIEAHLVGGPFTGVTLGVGSPYTPRELHLVMGPQGPLIVGTDRLVPDGVYAAAVYELERDSSELRPHPTYPGMEEGAALYRERP